MLGGGIGASPLLLRPVRGSAAALVPITARIETSLLGERAALQGAIAVALHSARTTLLSRALARAQRGRCRLEPRARPLQHRAIVCQFGKGLANLVRIVDAALEPEIYSFCLGFPKS